MSDRKSGHYHSPVEETPKSCAKFSFSWLPKSSSRSSRCDSQFKLRANPIFFWKTTCKVGPWLTRKDRRNTNKTGKRESKGRSQQDPVEGERGDLGWTLLLFMFSKGESADFSFVQSWWVTAWLPERNQTVLHSGLLKPGVQRLRADAIGFETFEPVRQWKTNSNKKKAKKDKPHYRKCCKQTNGGRFFFADAASGMPTAALWPEVSGGPPIHPFPSAIHYAWFWEHDWVWLHSPTQHFTVKVIIETNLLEGWRCSSEIKCGSWQTHCMFYIMFTSMTS